MTSEEQKWAAEHFGGTGSPEDGYLMDKERGTHLPYSLLFPCELPDLSRCKSVLTGKGGRDGPVDPCFDNCKALLGNKGYGAPLLSQRCP